MKEEMLLCQRTIDSFAPLQKVPMRDLMPGICCCLKKKQAKFELKAKFKDGKFQMKVQTISKEDKESIKEMDKRLNNIISESTDQ